MNAWTDPEYWEPITGGYRLRATPLSRDYPLVSTVLQGTVYARGELVGTLQGGGTPPSIPTLSASGSVGSVTFIISGSTAGASNSIKISPASGMNWTAVATIIGNGSTTVALSQGQYWGVATSTLGGTSVGVPILFSVSSDSGVVIEYTPAMVFSKRLQDLGLGSDPLARTDWPCFINHFPDNSKVPDDAICVYDTQGIKDGRVPSGEVIFHHGVQVRVRSLEHEVANQKIREIVSDVLSQGVVSVVMDDATFRLWNVNKTGAILPLGVESSGKRRFAFTVNFLLTMKEM